MHRAPGGPPQPLPPPHPQHQQPHAGQQVDADAADFWDQCLTSGALCPALLHFLHPVLCLANYLDWVRLQTDADELGPGRVKVYLTLCIVAILSFFLASSVFYTWAYRYSSDERSSRRRRAYGIIVNLFFSDLPLFILEVDILWEVGARAAIQILAFVVTCASFAYSAVRVWLFATVRVIKHADPPARLGGPLPGLPPGTGYAPGTEWESPPRSAGHPPGSPRQWHAAAEHAEPTPSPLPMQDEFQESPPPAAFRGSPYRAPPPGGWWQGAQRQSPSPSREWHGQHAAPQQQQQQQQLPPHPPQHWQRGVPTPPPAGPGTTPLRPGQGVPVGAEVWDPEARNLQAL
eukprot:TRINITY_DN20394_c0_g1_i1.p1 TRINITY_DN20394_c0_g1~~TRINITY_DN20394_c0_g1_i1.p1  ORF type:complete len:346 (+),score=92.97 TRINITY_DN20394_c0_g1_i1:89-1126(+)